MEPRVKPFVDRLAAVLKKDRWEGHVLGVEAGRAKLVVDESRKREREALDGVAQTEDELRDLCRTDQAIPLERRRILDLFLRHQYAVAAVKQKERVQAEEIRLQILRQLEAKHRAIRTMEKHAERKRLEHDGLQARAAFKAHDDAWLLRRR